MQITISTLPGHDANFGTWLQFISLYKFLEEKFKACPSIVSKPFIRKDMVCNEVFQKSFDHFDFRISDAKESDYIIIGSDMVLGVNSSWCSDKWFKQYVEFDGIDNNKKIVFSGGGIGTDKLLDTKYKDFFSSINYISFREKTSSEINKNGQYPNWTYTIDPSLLYDKEFYQQCQLKPNMKLPDEFDVVYTPHDWMKPEHTPQDAIELYNNPNIGMREFLWMMGHCRNVYTTAYHGTIFGMIFGRRIFNDMSGQFKTKELFNLFGIIVGKDNEVVYDWNKMKPILDIERKRSFDFLYKAFGMKSSNKIACYSKNQLVRDLSTSGGFSGIIANTVLSKGGVVYGASYVDGFRHIKTIRVDNISDYFRNIAKSKYSFCQDCDFSLVKQDLDNGIQVLFTGCPCQIKELKEFLEKDYENLITLDLKCHGYSDPKYLEDFIDQIESEMESKVVNLDMRYNHRVISKVVFANGVSNTYNNIGSIFINNKNMIDSCKTCNMHLSNNVSDITVGDFWEFKKETMDERFSPNNGTNIVVLNTQKGKELFNQIKDQMEVMYL